jgi:hypothetical protein
MHCNVLLVLANDRLSMKSVRKKPGSTTVAWIPSGAHSSCRAFVIPSTANLVEQYIPQPADARKPPSDEKFMMCPAFCRRIVGSTARMTFSSPKTLVR